MANMSLQKNPMPSQDPNVRNKNFQEVALGYTEAQALDEAQRCLNCKNKPCMQGCPVMVHIPEFIQKVAAGEFEEAYQIISNTSALPAVCGRVCPQETQCEKYCVRGKKGDPVGIGRLERFVADWHNQHAKEAPEKPAGNGHRVAVVGSGPAGLAAADQLNRRGHFVTVVEREERPGGLLAYGIPNMKLPKDVVARRIDLMTGEGVSFVTGVDAAEPEVARRLLEEYDAVILCCGAERPRPLAVDAAGISGVCYGTEFLKAAVERQQFGKDPAVPAAEGRDVVIVGTGDTASDCVATALRQGCKSVVQLVRRPAGDYVKDGKLPLDYAHEEALALFGEDPRRFGVEVRELISEKGALTGVGTSEGETLPCGLLIAATGFAGCAPAVCEAFGVEYGETVRTAEGRFATSVEKVFAAGDMRRGQSLVVWAIAEGRTVAAEVDEYLTGYTNIVRTV